MKKCSKLLIAAGLAFTVAFSSIVSFVSIKKEVIETEAYTNGDAATYYSNIGNKTGSELLSALQGLNSTKLQHRVGYNSMPSYFPTTDPGSSSGQTTSFYSGKSGVYSTSMNREHVWPASRTVLGRDKDPLEDDMHMVRPTLTTENSSRGNSFFAESGAWDPASFNNESYRGDAARIIFYCVVADSQLSLVDKNTDDQSNHTMGKLSDMLQWNINYSVANRENVRNEAVEELQGNRNPFIDHPEYACRIWGNTNDTTREICSHDTSGTAPTSLTLNVTSTSLGYGRTLQLSVTPTPSEASGAVSWSASNSKASVDSNGLVTAGTESGYVQITATSSLDNSVTATCQIYVTEPDPVAMTGVSHSSVSVGLNKTITLSPTVSPSDAYPLPSYTYQSNNTSIATVSNGGVVTGKAGGSTTITITATQGSITKTCNVSVTVTTEPVVVTDMSQLSNDDTVIVKTDSGTGVTGWNNSKDATVSTTSSEWKEFVVKDKSSSGFKLYDSTASQYIAAPGGNEFKYGSTGGTCSVDSSGHLMCSNRYLCVNGTNYRFYTAIGSYTPFYVYTTGGSSTPVRTLEAIVISGTLTNTQYVGFAFDPTGLTVTAFYDDESDEDVTSQVTWSPSTLTASTTSVTASYEGESDSINITVVTPTLTSISTTGQTTSYSTGDTFSYDGTCTATYNNGSQKTVTPTVDSSGVNMSAAGTYTVSLSYSENNVTKTTSYSITVSDTPFVNSIEQCYSMSDEQTLSDAVYGLYVGSFDGHNPVIMNGEFGILLFTSSSATLPSWTINETYVKVTAGKIDIFNNLYEIKNYAASTASGSEAQANVLPVSTYSVTGNEGTSDLTIASRLCLVTGTVKTAYNKGNATLTVNSKDVAIYVKSDYQSALSDVLGTVGNQVTLKGFTTFYTSFQVNVFESIEASSTYTAEDFAEDLMSMTNTICATSTNKNSDLSPVWVTLEMEKYSTLPASEKTTLKGVVASNSGTDIQIAMARYDFIVTHYSSCNDFIQRNPSLQVNNGFLKSIDNSTTITIIVVLSTISLTVIGGFVFLRKRKEN